MKQVTVVTVSKFFVGQGMPDYDHWGVVCTFTVDGHITQDVKDKITKLVLAKYPEGRLPGSGELRASRTTRVEFVHTTDLGPYDDWLIGQVLDTTIALRKG